MGLREGSFSGLCCLLRKLRVVRVGVVLGSLLYVRQTICGVGGGGLLYRMMVVLRSLLETARWKEVV